ncbi:MAG TPA: histidine kinase dimerization/phospho-acceptor domain-containing protein [Gaiellaceae bacterium]|nr:histidine kinase dimerization/phospho-acceptor domain-containing protein [Gaiellaceae bacterium]
MADNATNVTHEDQFSRLVLLACHDLRTPLATVHGFAQTLARQGELEEPAARYLEMINSASDQIADLVEELALGARIEAGRYDPVRNERDTLELAHAVAGRLGEERVVVYGEGAEVEIDSDATERALAALARCALRHGGLEEVRLSVQGDELELSPITSASAPVVLGTDLRDLGAAIAVRLLTAQGGSVELDGEALRIRPTGP